MTLITSECVSTRRVAVGIHCGDLDRVLETYTYMSEKWFTHATPTLFNAGARQKPTQLSLSAGPIPYRLSVTAAMRTRARASPLRTDRFHLTRRRRTLRPAVNPQAPCSRSCRRASC